MFSTHPLVVASRTRTRSGATRTGGAKGNTDFDEDVYEQCATEATEAGLKPKYHVYARLYLFQTSNVVFYQIPDRILRDFGLDLRGEPYSEE